MIKITIKANQIDMDVLLISKVDNIQKPCLSPKCGFFHYFNGLRILPSRTNIVPKIYRDLSALEGIILTSYSANDLLTKGLSSCKPSSEV